MFVVFVVVSRNRLFGPFGTADEAAAWIAANHQLFNDRLMICPVYRSPEMG